MDASEFQLVALAIEDRPSVQMFVTGFLRDAGVEVHKTAKAEEALIAFRARPKVQAVVIGIELPDQVDCFALARAIRERWPDVSLVIAAPHQSPGPEDLPKGFIFLVRAHLLEIIINLIRQMATPQTVELGSARTVAADPS